uniref:Uncharacterized protein n=2 Tax=Oryza sativa subsp. japonica TaxID=39947 RepID=Q94H46_ORYSJ|nr:hypothetical protein [Oryza sativa Japonica Group]ABF97088.1 hypothetical protein LOC_Os03g36060 [Oryza sativa Japonica Group]
MELGVFRASTRRGHASNVPEGCRLGLFLSSGRLEKLHRGRASQGGCQVGPDQFMWILLK